MSDLVRRGGSVGMTFNGTVVEDGDCLLLDNGKSFETWFNLSSEESDPESWIRKYAMGKHMSIRVIKNHKAFRLEMTIIEGERK